MLGSEALVPWKRAVVAARGRGGWLPRGGAGPVVVVVIAAAVLVGGGVAIEAAGPAGDDPLAVREAVGSGIHAFHAGEFNRAYDDLTQAVQAGSSDARVLYFRGLAALRLGRTDEAEADFVAGAEREIESGSARRISLSLERVQGHDRLMLERHRNRARLAGLQRDREAYTRRYSAIEDAGDDVRRRRRPEEIPAEIVAPGIPPSGRPAAAVEEMPAPPGAPARKPAADGDEPLFGEEMEEKAAPDDEKPAADAADAEEPAEEMAEEMAEEEKPAADAADADEPAEEMAEEETADDAKADGDTADADEPAEEMAEEEMADDEKADGDAADADEPAEEMAEEEMADDAKADADTTDDDAGN